MGNFKLPPWQKPNENRTILRCCCLPLYSSSCFIPYGTIWSLLSICLLQFIAFYLQSWKQKVPQIQKGEIWKITLASVRDYVCPWNYHKYFFYRYRRSNCVLYEGHSLFNKNHLHTLEAEVDAVECSLLRTYSLNLSAVNLSVSSELFSISNLNFSIVFMSIVSSRRLRDAIGDSFYNNNWWALCSVLLFLKLIGTFRAENACSPMTSFTILSPTSWRNKRQSSWTGRGEADVRLTRLLISKNVSMSAEIMLKNILIHVFIVLNTSVAYLAIVLLNVTSFNFLCIIWL